MDTKNVITLQHQQSFHLTHDMQLAIRLLQFSTQELETFVTHEMQENPLLVAPDDQTFEQQEPSREALLEEDNIYPGGSASLKNGQEFFLENYPAPKTLRDYLYQQLNMTSFDQPEKKIANFCINSLDENGYLPIPPTEIAKKLGVTVAQVTEVIIALQQFEPTGLFASNLKECFILQLKDMDLYTRDVQTFMEYWPLFLRQKFADLKKLCGLSDERFQEILALIKRLDAKPATRFEDQFAQTVVPEVIISPTPAQGWQVELNPDTLPKVLINKRYYHSVCAHTRHKKDVEYINERYHKANWLVKALDQRARTILKVAIAITESQDRFLRYGVKELVPLTLREIAQQISMNESTVSRVTSNKYMATPQGIYPLKFFFTSKIRCVGHTSSISASSVKQRIKELIQSEDSFKPLSDDEIVHTLTNDGIKIARRTVTKYRELMAIPPSHRRRGHHLLLKKY